MNRFFGNPHFKSYGELLHRLYLLIADGRLDPNGNSIREQMDAHSDHLNSEEIQALKFISTAYEAEIARQKGT